MIPISLLLNLSYNKIRINVKAKRDIIISKINKLKYQINSYNRNNIKIRSISRTCCPNVLLFRHPSQAS